MWVQRDAHVPFVIFTNGGGVSEQDKANALSQKLGTSVNDVQVVQAHTPFRGLVEEHKDHRILVVGKRYERLRRILHSYGFPHVVRAHRNLVLGKDFYS